MARVWRRPSTMPQTRTTIERACGTQKPEKSCWKSLLRAWNRTPRQLHFLQMGRQLPRHILWLFACGMLKPARDCRESNIKDGLTVSPFQQMGSALAAPTYAEFTFGTYP